MTAVTWTCDFDEIRLRITPTELALALGCERKGRGWRCPFPDHDDKNPSFSPYRNKNGYTHAKCWGCGRSGTPVQVAAALWGTDLRTAAERLARSIGMIV